MGQLRISIRLYYDPVLKEAQLLTECDALTVFRLMLMLRLMN